MPQRVPGILDGPQRVLAIVLQRKVQNALWAILIHSMNATKRCGPFFFFKRPTMHCGKLSEFANCPQRIVGTPTYQQHTNNIQTTLQQHTKNTPTYQ